METEQQDENNKQKDDFDNKAIIIAIIGTLFWTAVFASNMGGWAVLYLFIHPIIGKILAVVVEALCDALDSVYSLSEDKKWGAWDRETRIGFAGWWPIAALPALLLTLIGVIYGLLFKINPSAK